MPGSLITLTTDFGIADHFAGVMKGVIHSIAPRVTIVDITHLIPPFEILEGAFAVEAMYRWFPKKTIHVVVVDPGVGSVRRPVLVEAAGQYFIGPDNGVFSLLMAREKEYKVRHLTAEEYRLHPVSATFHGRDIFAPAAAHLAAGVAPGKLGKVVKDPWIISGLEPVRTGKRFWVGKVLRVDRFGNLITNFRVEEFPAVMERPFELLAGLVKISRLAATFSEGEPGELMVVPGSAGYFEVAANQASAAQKLGVAAGSPVELTLY
jgi:S-adenosylmethionine hydrolase